MEQKMIVICAPSGTGKTTLLDKLRKEIPDLVWSISCTTRKPREGELHGREYFFIKEESFIKQIENNDFIEWAKVHSNYYGTSKRFIDEGLKNNQKLLLDLDVQGADEMKRIYGDTAQVIFIEPPSVDELRRRLNKRGTDSESVIEERLRNAVEELQKKNDYDHLIMNDDFEVAYCNLKEVVEKIFKTP